jgi:cytoskeletal protein CcmA (bactofilin family)
MFKLKPSKNQKIDTLIGPNTRIDGNVAFSGGMHLDGYINGNVAAEGAGPAALWVGAHGGIEGSVMVSAIILNGVVKGDIEARGRVELGETARVTGSVTYSVIETAVGAQINGKLIHRAEPAGTATGAACDGQSEADAGDDPPL